METFQAETARYWNPILETVPQEKLQAMQLKKFKRIVAWAYNNSPFYTTGSIMRQGLSLGI